MDIVDQSVSVDPVIPNKSKADIKEISELISIRNYVSESMSNFSIDKSSINTLSGILILLDKKIISALTCDEFKEFIGFSDVKRAVEEVRNMKLGPKKG